MRCYAVMPEKRKSSSPGEGEPMAKSKRRSVGLAISGNNKDKKKLSKQQQKQEKQQQADNQPRDKNSSSYDKDFMKYVMSNFRDYENPKSSTKPATTDSDSEDDDDDVQFQSVELPTYDSILDPVPAAAAPAADPVENKEDDLGLKITGVTSIDESTFQQNTPKPPARDNAVASSLNGKQAKKDILPSLPPGSIPASLFLQNISAAAASVAAAVIAGKPTAAPPPSLPIRQPRPPVPILPSPRGLPQGQLRPRPMRQPAPTFRSQNVGNLGPRRTVRQLINQVKTSTGVQRPGLPQPRGMQAGLQPVLSTIQQSVRGMRPQQNMQNVRALGPRLNARGVRPQNTGMRPPSLQGPANRFQGRGMVSQATGRPRVPTIRSILSEQLSMPPTLNKANASATPQAVPQKRNPKSGRRPYSKILEPIVARLRSEGKISQTSRGGNGAGLTLKQMYDVLRRKFSTKQVFEMCLWDLEHPDASLMEIALLNAFKF